MIGTDAHAGGCTAGCSACCSSCLLEMAAAATQLRRCLLPAEVWCLQCQRTPRRQTRFANCGVSQSNDHDHGVELDPEYMLYLVSQQLC